MLIDFKIIDKKPTIATQEDGNIIDMFHQSVEYKKQIRFKEQPVIPSTSTFGGKPHTIVKSLYGNENYLDLFFTFNGISNPLVVDDSQILVVPDEESMNQSLVSASMNERNNNRNLILFRDKISKVDKRRIELIKKDSELPESDVRPGNLAITSPITATNGEIILGDNVSNTRCKAVLSPTQLKTEQIRKALKNKIMSQQQNVASASISSVGIIG